MAKKIIALVLLATFVWASPVGAQEDNGPLNGTFMVSAENAGSLQFFKTPTMLVFGELRYSMMAEQFYTTPVRDYFTNQLPTFRVCVEGEVEQGTRIFVSATDRKTDIATLTLTSDGEVMRDNDAVPAEKDAPRDPVLITLMPGTKCADVWVLLTTPKNVANAIEVEASIIVK